LRLPIEHQKGSGSRATTACPQASVRKVGFGQRFQIRGSPIAALKDAQLRHFKSPRIVGRLAYAYAVSGNKDDALKILEELKLAAETDDDALIRIAQVYIGLDDKERAFEWLEKAYQHRAHWLRLLKIDFIYDPLRSDPRFKDLVQRIGLPP